MFDARSRLVERARRDPRFLSVLESLDRSNSLGVQNPIAFLSKADMGYGTVASVTGTPNTSLTITLNGGHTVTPSGNFAVAFGDPTWTMAQILAGQELALVATRSTNVLTLSSRATYGPNAARSIQPGDYCIIVEVKKHFDDIEGLLGAASGGPTGSGSVVLAAGPTLTGSTSFSTLIGSLLSATTIEVSGDATSALTQGAAGVMRSAGILNAVGGFQVNGTTLAASHLSNGVTGSGAVALAVSPTFTGTLAAAAITASGAITAATEVIARNGSVYSTQIGFTGGGAPGITFHAGSYIFENAANDVRTNSFFSIGGAATGGSSANLQIISTGSGAGLALYNTGSGLRAYIDMDGLSNAMRIQNYNAGSFGLLYLNPSGGAVAVGGDSPISPAILSAVKAGNGLEWGHPNSSGYRNTLGSFATSGNAFMAFHGEAGGTAQTFSTRGVKTSLLYADLLGGFGFGSVASASAGNQTPFNYLLIQPSGSTAVITWAGATNLYGAGSGLLKTDGGIYAVGGMISAWTGSVWGVGTGVSGSSGYVQFNGDSTAMFTTPATGFIRASLHLQANGAINVDAAGGGSKLSFGSAGDASFSRSAANQIDCNNGSFGTLRAAAFTVSSDRQLKHNIEGFTDTKQLVASMLSAKPYTFRRDGEYYGSHLGMMAEELPHEVLAFGPHPSKPYETVAGIDTYKFGTALLVTVQDMNDRLLALENAA